VYIDPGVGSLLLQGLVAGIIGAGFALREKIRHVIAVILRRPRAPRGGE
jgi:hypothetical protein